MLRNHQNVQTHSKNSWKALVVSSIAHFTLSESTDGVSIVEAPDESIMSTLLSIESEGNARTVTLKAFTYEEGTKIIGNL